MTIELKRDRSAAMAQLLTIRSQALVADGSEAEGGADSGPSPHDLYDAALGACNALTVMRYARKKGIPVDDIHTMVERDDSGERSGAHRQAVKVEIQGEL